MKCYFLVWKKMLISLPQADAVLLGFELKIYKKKSSLHLINEWTTHNTTRILNSNANMASFQWKQRLRKHITWLSNHHIFQMWFDIYDDKTEWLQTSNTNLRQYASNNTIKQMILSRDTVCRWILFRLLSFLFLRIPIYILDEIQFDANLGNYLSIIYT